MGSKHALSNGNEVEEATQLLAAFDAIQEFRTAIVLYVVERGGKPRLVAGIGHAPALPMEQVLTSWGSDQFVLEASELVSLMAVITRLTYGLDAEMAEKEWLKAHKP